MPVMVSREVICLAIFQLISDSINALLAFDNTFFVMPSLRSQLAFLIGNRFFEHEITISSSQKFKLTSSAVTDEPMFHSSTEVQ